MFRVRNRIDGSLWILGSRKSLNGVSFPLHRPLKSTKSLNWVHSPASPRKPQLGSFTLHQALKSKKRLNGVPCSFPPTTPPQQIQEEPPLSSFPNQMNILHFYKILITESWKFGRLNLNKVLYPLTWCL